MIVSLNYASERAFNTKEFLLLSALFFAQESGDYHSETSQKICHKELLIRLAAHAELGIVGRRHSRKSRVGGFLPPVRAPWRCLAVLVGR